MANTYTYEDFEKALRDSGFSGQFSTADLALAKRNPDAGMSLLSYKQDWANATTDEMRALANAGAEEIRSSFGEYTGGTDGSVFHKTPLSPQQFEYGDAPSFTDKYGGDIEKLIKDQMNRDPYSYSGTAPTYTDNYAGRIEDLINEQINRKPYEGIGSAPVYESKYGDTADGIMKDILNRGEFQYDHTSDPLYSAYAKQYAREGKRATADALGEAASATGGLPSSYAVTAASQAGNYHAAQMADKIPELYQIAYDKYLNEYNMKLSDLNAAQGLEQFNYGMYQDKLSQYNRDRDFDYAKWLDEYEMGQQNIDTLRGLRGDEHDQYLAALGQYNADRNFNYAKLLDEIASQDAERQNKLSAEQREYERSVYEDERDYNRVWNEDERAYQRAQDEAEQAYSREQDAYDRAWNEDERAYQRGQDEREYQLKLLKAGEDDTAGGEASDYNDLIAALGGGSESGYNDLIAALGGSGELPTAGDSGEAGGTREGEYTTRDIALNLYEGAAEIGVTSWDDFEKMLVENGISEAEAEALTLEFRGIYGRDAFFGNKKYMANGEGFIDRFKRR